MVHCTVRYENRFKSSISKQVRPGSRPEVHKHGLLQKSVPITVFDLKSSLSSIEKIQTMWKSIYVFEDVQWTYYFQYWWAILKTIPMETDPSKAATLVQKNNCLLCARVENKLVYLWSNRANSSGRLCHAECNWNSIIRIHLQQKLFCLCTFN